jgi:RNA polymerase sigma-70 factor, ECF subfamily
MNDWLTERFEEHRAHLRAVAYRMLGSTAEADDAVQEAWLRVNRAGADGVENIGGWLTTIVARVCLNMLRSRAARREEPLDVYVPDPILSGGPEYEALLADSVGLALLVVLETLTPAERLAFVLHDLFGVPFSDIAPIVDRSPDAARQLASRARRRVRRADVDPEGDPAEQRAVVDAFFAAARDGDFEGLLAVLDPDVVLRADGGTVTYLRRGPQEVATGALAAQQARLRTVPVLVNGAPGIVAFTEHDRPFSVMAFTVRGGRIVEIDIVLGGELRRVDLSAVA